MIFDVSFVSPGSKAVTAPENSSLARYPVSSFNSRSAASSGVSPLSTNPDSGRPGNQYHGNNSSLSPPKHSGIVPAGNSRHILPVGGRNCLTRRMCLTPSFSSNAITSTAVKGQCQKYRQRCTTPSTGPVLVVLSTESHDRSCPLGSRYFSSLSDSHLVEWTSLFAWMPGCVCIGMRR